MQHTQAKPSVLVVDDTLDNLALVNEILKGTYRVRVATNGQRALDAARLSPPDIILLDVVMPVMDGYETCAQLKKDPRLRDIPVLFLTARADEDDERKGFALGAADYIVKPVSPPILLARVHTHITLKRSRDMLKRQNQDLDAEVQRRTRHIFVLQEASIMAMAALAETRDNETGHHLQRTKFYIQELACCLSREAAYRDILTPERIRNITVSAPLHDIGKVGIPDHILLNPGRLSAEEFELMKMHTIFGRDAILSAERLIGRAETFLTCAREIAYCHHEKWDGSGYPQGLSGEDIPLPARLMAIVDAYDALTAFRVYKDVVPHEQAVNIMMADAGTHFDPNLMGRCSGLPPLWR